jgi:hypothetical protein
MLEKIRGIQNPLTIIAIFAGLAEIAGTVALTAVSKEVQPIFIWFVMGFPTLLVVAFFATLNFNPKVLYAPSDFRTDDNFLRVLSGGREMSENFRGLTDQLEETGKNILKEAVKELGQANLIERDRITAIVDEQMRLLREKVESTRESAVETALVTAVQAREVVRCEFCRLMQYATDDSLCRRCGRVIGGPPLPRSRLQADILQVLSARKCPVKIADLTQAFGVDESWTTRAVEKLVDRKLVVLSADQDGNLQAASVQPSEPVSIS